MKTISQASTVKFWSLKPQVLKPQASILQIWSLNCSKFEVSSIKFWGLKPQPSNFEASSLKLWSLKPQSSKFEASSLKFWSLKPQVLKPQPSTVKLWSLKPQVLRPQASILEIWSLNRQILKPQASSFETKKIKAHSAPPPKSTAPHPTASTSIHPPASTAQPPPLATGKLPKKTPIGLAAQKQKGRQQVNQMAGMSSLHMRAASNNPANIHAKLVAIKYRSTLPRNARNFKVILVNCCLFILHLSYFRSVLSCFFVVSLCSFLFLRWLCCFALHVLSCFFVVLLVFDDVCFALVLVGGLNWFWKRCFRPIFSFRWWILYHLYALYDM